MKQMGKKFAVRLFFLFSISILFVSIIGCGESGSAGDGSNEPGKTASITLSSGATALPSDDNSSTFVSAVLKDSTGAAVERYTTVVFTTTLGSFQNGKQEYKAQTLDDSGQVTVPFLGGKIAGIAEITVSSHNIRQTTKIQVTSDELLETEIGSIGLVSGADALIGDGIDRTTIYATVKDTNNIVVPGVQVDFTTTLGSFISTGEKTASGVSDDQGIAKVVLLSGNILGAADVKAFVEGVSQAISVNITSAPSKPSLLAVTASQITVKTDNSDKATITATILDENRVPAEGVVVSFRSYEQSCSCPTGQISASTAVTDADGKAVIYFSSGTVEKKNQTVWIEASAADVPTKRIPVQVTGTTIEFSTQSGTNLVIGGDPILLTATVKDASGMPIYDAPVDFIVTPDYLNVNYFSSNTDVQGKFVSQISAKPVNPGDVLVIGKSLGASADITFKINEPEKVFRIVSPADDIVQQYTNSVLEIKVQSPDFSEVKFVTTVGKFESSGIETVQKTTVNGIATARLSSSTAGTATVDVYPLADPSIKDSVTVKIAAPPNEASKISLQAPANVAPSTPDVKSSVTVTAVIRNDNNQPVGNAAVSFSILNSVGGEAISPAVVYTNSYGEADAVFTAGELGSDPTGVTIVAKILDKGIADQRQIIITGTPASVTLGTSTKVESINNDTRYRLPMTVTVTDSNNSPVPNTKVSLNLWAIGYHKGGWTQNCEPVWVPYKTFPSEDANRNGRLDPGEDTNLDGVLTPESSAAGSIVPEVVTDEKGVAEFDLEYQKEMAVWITVGLTATTSIVQGTEVATTRSFVLPYAEEDACHLSPSPFNESEYRVEMLIEAMPTNIKADGSSTSEVKVLIRDDKNNPVSGTTVNFSTDLGTVTGMAITGEDGYAYVNGVAGEWPVLMSERRNGIATVTATAEKYVDLDGNTATATAEVSFTGVTLSLSSGSESLTTGDETALTALLKTPSGSPISGQEVYFESNSGLGKFKLADGNLADTFTGVTLTNGTLTIPFVSTSAGSETITAYHGPTKDKPGETKASVQLNISGKKLTITPASDSLVANGSSSMSIRLKLEDENGAVADQVIQLFTTLGSIDPVTAPTDANGEAVVTLTAGEAIGIATITATAELGGSVVSASNKDVSLVSGDAASIEVTRDPSIINVGTGTSELRVVVRDDRGNPVDGVQVAFTIIKSPGGGETITPATARTAGPGSTRPGQISATFAAGSLGSQSPGDVIIEVSAGSVSPVSTSLTISGNPAFISLGTSLKNVTNNNDGSYSIPVSAIVSDVNGISVPAGYVVSFSTNNPELGTFVSPKQTSDLGKAITQLTYPATKAGQPITIYASCGGAQVSSEIELPVLGAGVADVDIYAPSVLLADGVTTGEISATAKNLDGSYIIPSPVFSFETNRLADFSGESVGNITYNGRYFISASADDDSSAGEDFVSNDYDFYVRAESGGVYSEVKKITAKGISLTLTSAAGALIADGSSQTRLTAVLKETSTGLPIANAELNFGVTNGIVTGSATTDGSGTASVVFTTLDNLSLIHI